MCCNNDSLSLSICMSPLLQWCVYQPHKHHPIPSSSCQYPKPGLKLFNPRKCRRSLDCKTKQDHDGFASETACGVFLLLLRICHRTRLRVATESSTLECPVVPPPLWIVMPRCSRTLRKRKHVQFDAHYRDRLYPQISQSPPIGRPRPMRK